MFGQPLLQPGTDGVVGQYLPSADLGEALLAVCSWRLEHTRVIGIPFWISLLGSVARAAKHHTWARAGVGATVDDHSPVHHQPASSLERGRC